MSAFAIPPSFQNLCPEHAGGPPGFLIAQLIQTLIAAHCAFNNPKDYPKDYGDELKDDEEFDFVIVGAGSSGSVIASRLSENPNWKVLLVEAGGDPTFASDVPGFLFSTQGTDIDWMYRSEKRDYSCLGMIDQRCPYPRGKVLGGSSSINAMLYVRGNPSDYEEWSNLGNKEWNYENILKFFKRSQNLNGYYMTGNMSREESRQLDDLNGRLMSDKFHSSDGPLSVSPFASGSLEPVKNAVFQGFEELNIRSQIDFNGERQIGVSNAPGTLFQGTRANTAKMFLNPVKDRSNLFVLKKTMAKRLIIKNNKVEGVELVRNHKTKLVKARKEVIVSGGAINSPQLLLLSGVGPKTHLQSMGIPVVLDLEGVGHNLQDHFIFFGMPFSYLKSKAQPLPPIVVLDAMYMFLTRRASLFSSIGLTDMTGFVDTKGNSTVPDIQFMFVNFLKEDSYLLPEVMRVMHLTDDIKQQYFDMVKESSVLVIAPVLLKPKGRGKVELTSTNPLDPPKIHADILKEEEDKATLLRGIKFLSKLKETAGFKSLEPDLKRIDVPECKGFTMGSDEYWNCLMKYLTTSLYHPVGTCKMGPASDTSAVVDDRLRVHGIKNLRIADASIMPTIVRGNTNAACIMIGEKCADFIKTDWEWQQHTEL
ncbi:hypothetical protein RUM44_012251 [Polyplax serrata]|uniref:Glucose-methanol-choline oxidoreductase N-terminal domain-containing protein n=1 Tax=Polyplax serrata TaxID=468196 RepID=A0ABR1BCX0_POLSC